mgnify:CR=1 FL=1
MLEVLTVGSFCASLFYCLFTGTSILYALIFAFFLFCGYALYRGFSLQEIGRACRQSIAKISNIIIVMLLIGALTASWRASGTIKPTWSAMPPRSFLLPGVSWVPLFECCLEFSDRNFLWYRGNDGCCYHVAVCRYGRLSVLGRRGRSGRSLCRRSLLSGVDQRAISLCRYRYGAL